MRSINQGNRITFAVAILGTASLLSPLSALLGFVFKPLQSTGTSWAPLCSRGGSSGDSGPCLVRAALGARSWGLARGKALGPHGGHGCFSFTPCHLQSTLGTVGTPWHEDRTGHPAAWGWEQSQAQSSSPHRPRAHCSSAFACSPGEMELLSSPARVPGARGIIFISFAAGLGLWRVSFMPRAFPRLLLITT